jgi:hypothetical protein
MLRHRGQRFASRVKMAAKVQSEARQGSRADTECDMFPTAILAYPVASDKTLADDSPQHSLLARWPRLQQLPLLWPANRTQR